MRVDHRVVHLVSRFLGSFDPRPPRDLAWVRAVLSESEFELWTRMVRQDQRHSIAVARRFEQWAPQATRAEKAAALLHDVGKSESRLGTWGRVGATLLGPRTDRWSAYVRHEEIGLEACRRAGSDPRTLALLVRSDDPIFVLIDRADDGRRPN